MSASARSALIHALGLNPGASDDDVLAGVKNLLDDDDSAEDGGSNDRTATRAMSDPRHEMARLVGERMTSKGITFKQAFEDVSRDPRHQRLSEKVREFYDPNARLRGR